MATRTVAVELSANVRNYVDPVERAARSTDHLRATAERFSRGRYEAKLGVDTRTATADLRRFDKSVGDSVIKVAALGRALGSVAVPAGLAAAAPQLASLGSAAVSASGSLLLLPAAGAAAAAGVGALVVGMKGFGAALEVRDDAVRFAEAISKLSPAARDAAVTIRGLGPAWTGLRLDVQERLFAGLSAEIQQLSGRYLPVLQSGLGGVATELNASARNFSTWASSARVAGDVGTLFDNIRVAMRELVPAGTNVAAALTDIGVVGSEFLPELAAQATQLTARFREWIAEARQSGDLAVWIQKGIDTLSQLGRIAGDVGGILSSVFDAADASGTDFLGTVERATDAADRFLNSARGESALLAVFTTVRNVVDALLPGLKAVGAELLSGIGGVAPHIAPLAAAFSDVLVAAAPLLGTLSELVSTVLPPLTAVIGTLAPLLGPVAAGFIAVSAASKGLSAVQGAVVGLGQSLGGAAVNAGIYAEKLGAGEAAQGRFATAGSKVADGFDRLGRSIPVAGAALVGLSLLYSEFGSVADEVTQKVVSGSLSVQQAINAEAAAIERDEIAWLGGRDAQESYALASANVLGKLNEVRAALGPLERAQLDVTIAQGALNDALRAGSATSLDVQLATTNLEAAKRRLTDQERLHADATRFTTDALIEQTNAAAGAANADIALQQAVLRTADAQDRAKAALEQHTASSREGQRAIIDLTQATYDEAVAAGRKAQADAEATGAADAAAKGNAAYTQRLIELAAQASGPTRSSLLGLVANLDTTRSGANDAALAAVGLTDDIDAIPASHATNISTPGLAEARAGITGLTREILNIQGKTVDIFVTATGQGGLASAGRLATGGILPGYSPGRDIHRFVGAAGALDLSGGEAVMRPEWTRAVTPEYVHAANAAARRGGVRGVAEFLERARTEGMPDRVGFAAGGIIGHRRFADGGVFARFNYAKDLSRFNAAMAGLEAKARELGTSKWASIMAASSAGGISAGSGGAPVPTPGGPTYGGVRPHVAAAGHEVTRIFGPMPGGIGGVGQRANASDHPKGLALDFMTLSNTGLGNRVSQHFLSNWGRLAVKYVIWRQRINSGGAWRGMEDRGSPTANHMDHPHVSFLARAQGGLIPTKLADRGAYLRSGEAAVNLSGKLERVLSPDQTKVYDRIAEVANVRGGAQLARVGAVMSAAAGFGPGAGGVSNTEVVKELRGMRSAFAEVADAVRKARPITVEDKSGDPSETARKTVLALRMY